MGITWQEKVVSDLHRYNNKRIIIRLDLNLPTNGDIIEDTIRLDAVIPFLTQMSFAGAKMILLSHFGEKGASLSPVAQLLMQKLPFITFCDSLDINTIRETTSKIEPGNGVLLENVRLFPGETENATSLAEAFASLGDMYINNAFSVSHRNHASLTGIPKYLLSFIGPTCANELTHLTPILTPRKPALLVIGGAKISTKLSIINRYLDQGVDVFVGGAMVHNILKARGISIGESFYDKDYTVTNDVAYHPNILIPKDVILSTGETADVNNVPADGVIVDCGKATLEMLDELITKAETIIVNGPLGLYEKGWMFGTESLLSKISKRPKDVTYIGGGDTVDVASKVNALHAIGFVSLGGGAMLEFLSSGTLIAIDAVTESNITG